MRGVWPTEDGIETAQMSVLASGGHQAGQESRKAAMFVTEEIGVDVVVVDGKRAEPAQFDATKVSGST